LITSILRYRYYKENFILPIWENGRGAGRVTAIRRAAAEKKEEPGGEEGADGEAIDCSEGGSQMLNAR
jgi:hypothetical protein